MTRPILRHGYYAARKGEHHGDPVMAYLAEEYWKRLGHTVPSVVDGVACWRLDMRDPPIVRLAALDLFSEQPRVLVREWNHGWKKVEDVGLDTTHGCWHGAYSAFMRWREKLAEVAGYPPLFLMEGFYDPEEFWCWPQGGEMHKFPEGPPTDSERRSVWSFRVERVCASLPISWEPFKNDPLVKLLYHSDCDGSIAAADCGPIADRLAELLPKLPEGGGGGHIGDWREKTQTFIDGLREAAAAGEDVEFH